MLVRAASRVVIDEIEPVGRRPTTPGASLAVSDLAAECDFRQVLHVPLGHPLFDANHEIVRVAAGQILVAVDDLDAGLAELMPEVACLVES